MSSKEFDTFDIAGQQATREEEAARAKQRAKVAADDLRWVMSNPRGRRHVFGVLDRAGVFRCSFDKNALQMAFYEGARNEGLRLTTLLMEACPEQWQVMLNEQKDVTQ